MSSTKTLHLAIIGFGPRALGALEALTARAIEKDLALEIDIFDPLARLGAGPNFDPEQSDLCILNIPVRILDYMPPQFMADHIKPFLKWSSGRYQPDDFPPRSDVGVYLNDRFDALYKAVPRTISIRHVNVKATGLEKSEAGWQIMSDTEQHGPYEEVLLTQGQPETAPDPQLDRWIKHASAHNLDLLHAYPANTLIAAAHNWSDRTVAIRGLGLSTLDVLRMLTKGLGGTFQDGVYTPSGREPRKIIPFSLDGKAPVAKPATKALDDRYNPTSSEVADFKSALSKSNSKGPEGALKIICNALVAPAARILEKLGNIKTHDEVRAWLTIERDDPGAQDDLNAIEALQADIKMAHGRTAPSVGYVIGQVWRKLQGELRVLFNTEPYKVETAMAIIGFDEALKRYSYGPPVFAAEELLALINHGIVSLGIVDDPDIGLSDHGWQLIEGNDVMFAQVMVDAVIPSPSLEHVTDPLVSCALKAGLVHAIEEGMGAQMRPDAQLIGADDQAVNGLSMLGRLTLGSVIAVDGLDDCFGPSTVRWANGVIERFGSK
ncbi:FAD/NAD(P)-binding protein [Maritalea sp.]|uniref:FAD/NAD(P)-binding protein n=1 Tax=Maritalea sp. TaxID=2003361 RepID=UPI003EF3A720